MTHSLSFLISSHLFIFFSGGSDNILNLWRVASCSSAPWIGADESGEGDETDPPDIKVTVRVRASGFDKCLFSGIRVRLTPEEEEKKGGEEG